MQKIYRIDYQVSEKNRLYIDARDLISFITEFIFNNNEYDLEENTVDFIVNIIESLIITNEENPTDEETIKVSEDSILKLYNIIFKEEKK